MAEGPNGIVAELAAAGFENARQVGKGGAGVVYRCHEAALGRKVAIKVLPSSFDEESRERFLREGYAMGGLSGHPNILNILQVGVTPSGRPYIVMPYCSEDSLAVRLRREGPVSWPEALPISVKLCGALETAHKTGILHRDIKPANVLINDYGEPQLADFGIAHIEGGYQTITGYFSGTIDYTAPEVLAGNPGSVASDIYSLGATIYTLIAGNAAHERQTSEELIAQYLRITSTPVPDLRPEGIPDELCLAIEHAMALDPNDRPASAEELGRELQSAQRSNGLKPDPMSITRSGSGAAFTTPVPVDEEPSPSIRTSGHSSEIRSTAPPTFVRESTIPSDHGLARDSAGPATSPRSEDSIQREFSQAAGLMRAMHATEPPPVQAGAADGPPPGGKPPAKSRAAAWFGEPGKKRNRIGLAAAALFGVLLLVAGGVYFALPPDKGDKSSASQPTTQAPVQWKPTTDARVARVAVAATQVDGTIWLLGGIRSNGAVTPLFEGYDPTVDEWKGGDDLPVPVAHASAVTWQDSPVILGGWKSESGTSVATEQVWRVANSRWVELPHMLQPRAAAAAATVGDRIVVTGGVDANGALLNTTEVFDGNSWSLGAPLPTPRKLLATASDGKLLYTVGGTNGNSDLATVEAYDPAAKTWAALAGLPQPRSDLGAAVTDGRLVAVGGVSSGQVLTAVSMLDLTTQTWSVLPDMATARHGAAVGAVEKQVYAIGGSTAVGDGQVISSAEVLKLPPRKTQPAPQWRALPDAPTARLMMAWAVLNNKIWIMGGLRNGTALTTVESFDPHSGAWETGPPLPIPLHHAAGAAYHGEVVVLGGTTENIANGSNKVFALRGGNWVELPSLTHARAAPAAAVVGDTLVVVGGQNNKQLVPQTEIFDGTSWKDAADLPIPREHLAAVSDGTAVYVVGGRFLSSDKNTAAFHRFDPGSGTWTRLVGMPTPRGSFGAAYIDGRIVAVGGEEPTMVLNVAEAYDIAAAKWSTLPPVPSPLHAEVVATVGNTVYCIGGANKPTHEGAIATVDALDFM